MITFMEEEQENGEATAWIEIESQHSDICSILVGEDGFLDDGYSYTGYATYPVIDFDIFKLKKFVEESTGGETVILEWQNNEETHYQFCRVSNLNEFFKVEVGEDKVLAGQKYREEYSYLADKNKFRDAVHGMHELYQSINN